MPKTEDFELSIEQQLALESYRRSLPAATREQLTEMFLEVIRQLMVKDNVIKQLIKNPGGFV